MKFFKFFVLAFALAFALTACTKSTSPTDGAKQMQDTLVQMQKDVDANDAAKTKADADKLEESWEKFEDGVKKNQADVYQKVEEPLGAIQSAAGQTTLDQATLKDQINKLNEALNQIK